MAKKLPELGTYSDEDMRALLAHVLDQMDPTSAYDVIKEETDLLDDFDAENEDD